VRLVVGAECAGAFSFWILDGRPTPAVAIGERLGLVRSVRDVDAKVRELRILLLELCVGDRLALARASPG
jgi:hypothetical protein